MGVRYMLMPPIDINYNSAGLIYPINRYRYIKWTAKLNSYGEAQTQFWIQI